MKFSDSMRLKTSEKWFNFCGDWLSEIFSAIRNLKSPDKLPPGENRFPLQMTLSGLGQRLFYSA